MKVAIINPSGRIDKITKPLDISDIKWEIEPKRIREYDLILLDVPDQNLLKELLRGSLYSKPVVYRMRGNVFRVLSYDNTGSIRHYVALNHVIPRLSGLISITDYHKAIVKEKYPNLSVEVVRLPIITDYWPDIRHTENYLSAMTLTNAYYRPKIKPLVNYAPAVNRFLQRNGGIWNVYANNPGYNTDLTGELDSYSHINFCGYAKYPRVRIKKANIMLHFSDLDVFPNAILEAMASCLPVITNNHPPFVESCAPNNSVSDKEELLSYLYGYQKPLRRNAKGKKGKEYVQKYHDPQRIGEDFKKAFRRLL